MTTAPVVIASGLQISSVAYQSATAVRYYFTGAPDLSALTTSHYFCPSGFANPINNVSGKITAIHNNVGSDGIYYVEIRNDLGKLANTLDETFASGYPTATVYASQAAKMVLIRDTFDTILNIKVKAANGVGFVCDNVVQIDTNTSSFNDRGKINIEIEGQLAGDGVLVNNWKRGLGGVRASNSTGSHLLILGPSSGGLNGPNVYQDVIDMDAVTGIGAGYGQTVRSQDLLSKFINVQGRTPSVLRGTTVITAGTTTATLNMGGDAFLGYISSLTNPLTAGSCFARSPDPARPVAVTYGTATVGGLTTPQFTFTIPSSSGSNIPIEWEIRAKG